MMHSRRIRKRGSRRFIGLTPMVALHPRRVQGNTRESLRSNMPPSIGFMVLHLHLHLHLHLQHHKFNRPEKGPFFPVVGDGWGNPYIARHVYNINNHVMSYIGVHLVVGVKKQMAGGFSLNNIC